jgi:plastocyanin
MRRLTTLGILAVTVLAACGGNGGGTAQKTATQKATTATTGGPPVSLAGTVNDHGTKTLTGTELEMELDDFYFGPTFVKAPGGTTVKVALENEGKAPHTFTIDALGVDKVLQPGEKATVTVALPAGGTVAFYCRFHKASGMQGAFAVGGASAAAAGY